MFSKQHFVGKVEGSITDNYELIKVNLFYLIIKGNRIWELWKSFQS